MTKAPGKAVTYLRVSSKRQMGTAVDVDADGNSIATQREACNAKAVALGATVEHEFMEPGQSAQTIAKRPVFRDLLRYVTEHRDIDYVIIYMRSRAFRNLGDAVLTKRQLEQLGTRLVSAKEDFGEGIMADAMEAANPDEIADPMLKSFRHFADEQKEDRLALAACSRGARTPLTRDSLSAIRRPTLVVAGARDQLAGPPQGLADAIAGAKAVTLPGCDHFSCIGHPLFKASVFDFFDGWLE